MYLGLVIVQDTMTPVSLSFVHSQIDMASAACIKMGKIYRKIEALKDFTIFKDNLDDLRGDLGDIDTAFQKYQAPASPSCPA